MDLDLKIAGVHHVAIICSDYEKSRRFYSEILGLVIVSETYRADRDSYKIDLALPDGSQIELFSFPGRRRALHIRKRVDCATSRSLSTISTVLSPLSGVAEFPSKTCVSMSSPENDSHSLQIPMDSLWSSTRCGIERIFSGKFFGKIAQRIRL